MNNEKIVTAKNIYFPISLVETQKSGAHFQLWKDEAGECLVSKIEPSGKTTLQRHGLINGLDNKALNLKHQALPHQLLNFNFIHSGNRIIVMPCLEAAARGNLIHDARIEHFKERTGMDKDGVLEKAADGKPYYGKYYRDHHIVPVTLENHPLVLEAKKSGFEIENPYNYKTLRVNYNVPKNENCKIPETQSATHPGGHSKYITALDKEMRVIHKIGIDNNWTDRDFAWAFYECVEDLRYGIRKNMVILSVSQAGPDAQLFDVETRQKIREARGADRLDILDKREELKSGTSSSNGSNAAADGSDLPRLRRNEPRTKQLRDNGEPPFKNRGPKPKPASENSANDDEPPPSPTDGGPSGTDPSGSGADPRGLAKGLADAAHNPSFEETIQTTHLEDTYNSTNPNQAIAKQGASSSEIGGVGIQAGLIQGIHHGLQDLINPNHVFLMPIENGEMPFTQPQLQQIIRELAIGIFVHDKKPMFSLHFNQDGSLFPVLGPEYEHTLVGYTMGMLDYIMKGFLNGAIFKEEFIKSWNERPNKDTSNDLSQLIDFKQHIAFHGVRGLPYRSVRECLHALGAAQNEDFDATFSTSFRIIADSPIRKAKDGFMIGTDFRVEYTIEGTPAFNSWLQRYQKEHGKPPPMLRLIQSEFRNLGYGLAGKTMHVKAA